MARDSRRTVANGAEIIWWVSLTVIFAFVALGALAAGAAVWPASCTPCHSAQVTALGESGHASAHCDDCHAAGGMFALVDNRLSVAAMVPAQIIPGGSPDEKVTNDGCLGCRGHDPADDRLERRSHEPSGAPRPGLVVHYVSSGRSSLDRRRHLGRHVHHGDVPRVPRASRDQRHGMRDVSSRRREGLETVCLHESLAGEYPRCELALYARHG